MPIIEGGLIYPHEGSPEPGVDEVRTLLIVGFTPGATFQVAFGEHVTGLLVWTNAKPALIALIQSALEALPLIGEDNVLITADLTGGSGSITITFRGILGQQPIASAITLTRSGHLPVVATVTQQGAHSPSAYGASRGALMIDVIHGKLYQNRGLSAAPIWELVSLQTA